MTYFRAVGQKAEHIVLVHGEAKSAEALARAIGSETEAQILVPEPGNTLEVSGTI